MSGALLKAGLAVVAIVGAAAAGFALSVCLQRRRRNRRMNPVNQLGPESDPGGTAIPDDTTSYNALVHPDYVPLVLEGDPDEDEVVIHGRSRQLPFRGAHNPTTQEPQAGKHEPSASNADPPQETVGPLVHIGTLEELR